jgi:hypothetical protein
MAENDFHVSIVNLDTEKTQMKTLYEKTIEEKDELIEDQASKMRYMNDEFENVGFYSELTYPRCLITRLLE